MKLPSDVFLFRGPHHAFVVARTHTYRELLRAGTYVELLPFERVEAAQALAEIARNDSGD